VDATITGDGSSAVILNGGFGYTLKALNFGSHAGSVRDLLVGAPYAQGSAGSAFIVYGPIPAGATVLPGDTDPLHYDISFLAVGANLYGETVGNMGNLGGADQSTDNAAVIFSAKTVSQGYVFAPRAAPVAPDALDPATDSLAILTAPAASRLGRTQSSVAPMPIASARDVAIGAAGVTTVYIVAAASVSGMVTLDASTPNLMNSSPGFPAFLGGRFVAGSPVTPDLDGNGAFDLVGMTEQARLFLYYDALGAGQMVDYNLDVFAGYAFAGDSVGIAFLGDVDGDGVSDLAAGDPRFVSGGREFGRMVVLR
jgi:hypothetical protein